MAELQSAQRRRRRNTRIIPTVVVAVAVIVVLILVTGLSSGGKKNASPTTTIGPSTTVAANATACPSFTGSSKATLTFAQAPPLCITKGGKYTETLHLNVGDVTVQFDTTKTPNTANNFIVLSLYHYYDGTHLFRTDTSIGIIQGGSPHTQSASDPGPGYTINDEGSGYTYAPGDLVMARSSGPNSAGAQFFFCVTNACSNLNSQGTYVVFAHVTSGLPILQQILNSNVNTNNGLGGAPAKLTLIQSTTVTQS
ncbi:MAG TPA: peptidylprolyl isomerase [Acidimicrobiales bacterium]|nr:peptidylprolyl isomerase [Acidimicrobiales bacterium]